MDPCVFWCGVVQSIHVQHKFPSTEGGSVNSRTTYVNNVHVQLPVSQRPEKEDILDMAWGNVHFQQQAWGYFAFKYVLRCSNDRSLVEKICDSMGFRTANRLRVDKVRTTGGFCVQPLLRIMKESDRGQTITHTHSADCAAVGHELPPVRPVLCHQPDLFRCRRVILAHHSDDVLMGKGLGASYRAYLLASSSSGFLKMCPRKQSCRCWISWTSFSCWTCLRTFSLEMKSSLLIPGMIL